MTTSKHPESDALHAKMEAENERTEGRLDPKHDYYDWLNFAARLEEQRDEARRERDGLKTCIAHDAALIRDLKAEADALAGLLENLVLEVSAELEPTSSLDAAVNAARTALAARKGT